MNAIIVILAGYLILLIAAMHLAIALARAAAHGDKQIHADTNRQLATHIRPEPREGHGHATRAPAHH